MENWKEIEGYPDYMISDSGRIVSLKSGYERVMKPTKCTNDYLIVGLYIGKKQKLLGVHRLVASHFLQKDPNRPYVNHKDGVKYNNNVSNLEYCTAKENTKHSWDNKLSKPQPGESNGYAKLTEKQVLEIREIGRTKTLSEIASMYNICYANVSNILNRHIWKHI